MTDFKWRPKARVVAFCDVALGFIGMALLVLTFLEKYTEKYQPSIGISFVSPFHLSSSFGFSIFVVILLILMSGFRMYQLFYANLLITGTSPSVKIIRAWDFSRNWRTSNIFLFVLTTTAYVCILGPWWFGIIETISRVVFIYIVHSFIKELETEPEIAELKARPLPEPQRPILLNTINH